MTVGKTLDAIRHRQVLLVVGVDLGEQDIAAVLFDELLEDRRQGPARSAPGGPEVDHHGGFARLLQDLRLEVLLGRVEHMLGFAGHRVLPVCFSYFIGIDP